MIAGMGPPYPYRCAIKGPVCPHRRAKEEDTCHEMRKSWMHATRCEREGQAVRVAMIDAAIHRLGEAPRGVQGPFGRHRL